MQDTTSTVGVFTKRKNIIAAIAVVSAVVAFTLALLQQDGEDAIGRMTARGTRLYSVESEGRATPEFRERLAANGAGFVGYLSSAGCLVEATEEAARKLRSLPAVREVRARKISEKVAARLGKRLAEADENAMLEVSIALVNGEDMEAVLKKIGEAGGVVRNQACPEPRFAWIYAELSPSAVGTLAECGEIKWMETAPRFKRTLNVVRDLVGVGTAVTNVAPAGLGLTGRGQIVAHADGGIDTGDLNNIHPDFSSENIFRLESLVEGVKPIDIETHGTHTASTIVGSGAASGGRFRGIAHGAKLYHQAYQASEIFNYAIYNIYQLYLAPYEAGARIRSDSWGDDGSGEYTFASQMADLFVWKHPCHTGFISAGNEGVEDAEGVVDNPSIVSPASAKNVICVGATKSTHNSSTTEQARGMATFSSCGPTPDGRIKPDICAPGSQIVAAQSSHDKSDESEINYFVDETGVVNKRYAYLEGTSMACPVAAGTATLMREYLERDIALTNASSALMRAMLIGGAHPVVDGEGNEAPAINQGWGEIDLCKTIAYGDEDGAAAFYFDRVDNLFKTNSNKRYWTASFNVTNSAAPFTVALAWADYPADPCATESGATKTLINDYDLMITDPDGVSYMLEEGEGDHVNSQEKISIETPAEGIWKVTVIATNVVDFSGGAAAVYARGAMTLESSDDVKNTDDAAETSVDEHVWFDQKVLIGTDDAGEDFYHKFGSNETQTYSALAACSNSAAEIKYDWYFDETTHIAGDTNLTEVSICLDDYVPEFDAETNLSALADTEIAAFKSKTHKVKCIASVAGGGMAISEREVFFYGDFNITCTNDVQMLEREALNSINDKSSFTTRGDTYLFETGVYPPVFVAENNITLKPKGEAKVVLDGNTASICVGRITKEDFDLPDDGDAVVPVTVIGFTLRNGRSTSISGVVLRATLIDCKADPWPYEDNGWSDPEDDGAMTNQLIECGFEEDVASRVTESGYNRLVEWSLATELAANDFSEYINNGGAPLLRAAVNDTAYLDEDNGVINTNPLQIVDLVVTPSNSTLAVSLGDWNLLSANTNLLLTSLGLSGSEIVDDENAYSPDNLEIETAEVTAKTVNFTVKPSDSGATNFFFRVNAK